MRINEMRNHFRVGLGLKVVALRLQSSFHVREILDDAVVHERDAVLQADMGVRVLLRHSAVRRPPAVRYSHCPSNRAQRDFPLDLFDLPDILPDLDLAIVDCRDAGGIIAAVLQLLQPFDKQGPRLTVSDIPKDAAHKKNDCPALFKTCRLLSQEAPAPWPSS